MTAGTAIVLAVVIALVALAVLSLIRGRRSGKSTCGCDCGSCGCRCGRSAVKIEDRKD